MQISKLDGCAPRIRIYPARQPGFHLPSLAGKDPGGSPTLGLVPSQLAVERLRKQFRRGLVVRRTEARTRIGTPVPALAVPAIDALGPESGGPYRLALVEDAIPRKSPRTG
jgi:hypothetical protein